MAGWFRKSLGDRVSALATMDEIHPRFDEIFAGRSVPHDAAVFSHDEWRGESKIVTVWFSPSARPVALACNVQPCSRPEPRNLQLEIGDRASRAALFPEDP